MQILIEEELALRRVKHNSEMEIQRVPTSGGGGGWGKGNSPSLAAVFFRFTTGPVISHATVSLQTGVTLWNSQQLRSQDPATVRTRRNEGRTQAQGNGKRESACDGDGDGLDQEPAKSC